VEAIFGCKALISCAGFDWDISFVATDCLKAALQFGSVLFTLDFGDFERIA
jgi:hypothetical protein